MDIGPLTVAVVLACILLASSAQAVAGFGFALIAVPLLVAVLDVRDAIVVATLLGILNSGALAYAHHRHVPWPTVGPMLAGAFAGMPLGLVVLLFAPSDVIRLLVGVVTLVLTLALLRGLRIENGSLAGEVAAGAISGALNTSTGTNGPPVVLYLQGRAFAPEEFRAALAVFFFTCNVVTLAGFLATGVVTRDAVALFSVATPAIAAGILSGRLIASRVTAAQFRPVVFVLLVVSALAAVASAVEGLL